jgi:site-specific recombinase XerD
MNNAIVPLFSTDYNSLSGDYEAFVTACGAEDYNRSSEISMVRVQSDTDAIFSFLQEFRDSPLTYQSYAKEIERLLLWCMHSGGVGLASLRRNHFLAYQEFLKDPQPRDRWCGTRVRRFRKEGDVHEDWRPFGRQGMSATTMNKTITILDAFFNYLVQIHYLMGNPLALDRRRKKRHRALHNVIDRYLESAEIQAVLERVKADDFSSVRTRYILLLLFYTGLRISEAAKHSMGDCLLREGQWFLRVIGKGQKRRDIPLPDALLIALKDFRMAIGCSTLLPGFKESTPLIPMRNRQHAISVRRIDQILKKAFSITAAQLEEEYPQMASKLRVASAHWLRHSYVTYLLKGGASMKAVQENAGHSDASTTMHYCHVVQSDRHAETRDLSLCDHDRRP